MFECRAGSENDALLPLTMTHDRRKFRNNPPWRSKVNVWKPWRGIQKEENKENKL